MVKNIEEVLEKLRAIFHRQKEQIKYRVTQINPEVTLKDFSIVIPEHSSEAMVNRLNEIINLSDFPRHDGENRPWIRGAFYQELLAEEDRGRPWNAFNTALLDAKLFDEHHPNRVLGALEQHQDELQKMIEFDLNAQILVDEIKATARRTGRISPEPPK